MQARWAHGGAAARSAAPRRPAAAGRSSPPVSCWRWRWAATRWRNFRPPDTAFGAFIGRWLRWPQLSDRQFARLVGDIFTLLLSLPVGAWLFGLVGGALRRTRPPLAEGDVYRALGRAPRLPALTGQLAVGGLCAVYALFFAVQAAEFLPALGAPLAPQQVSPLCGGRVLAAVPHPAA